MPIVERDTFLDLWRNDRERISSTLICDLYATSLRYWSSSEALKPITQPDSAFAWNQAVAALEEDFVSPSMTTLHSVLIDLGGRPALELRHNLLNVGRAVSLAHTLGLHRNPTSWQMLEAEKNLRIRLWWTVVIHDYWSSLTHGTPPDIRGEYTDVPLPSETSFESCSTAFAKLCSLTKILGNILPLIYALNPEPAEMWKSIQGIEYVLDEFEEEFPAHPQENNSSSGNVNGNSNLKLCLLAVRLAFSRVAFRVSSREAAIDCVPTLYTRRLQ